MKALASRMAVDIVNGLFLVAGAAIGASFLLVVCVLTLLDWLVNQG